LRTPPNASGSEVVGAATIPPVGSYVSSFSVISERLTASRHAGLLQTNRQRLDQPRHHSTVRSRLSTRSGTKCGVLCDRWYDKVNDLDVDPNELIHRVFQKNLSLDYYESGADVGLSEDMFESFIMYQNKLAKEFSLMQKRYGLIPINGNRTIEEINTDLLKRIGDFLHTTAE
jgi:hypothetical protein